MTYSNKTTKISKKPLISLKNITVKYDDLTALNDISFDIDNNDYLYIIGPNGAGKSTLIKLLTGLLKPTHGFIEVNSHLLGYLPQNLNQKQNFPITVNEVIYTGFKKQSLIISKSDLKIINKWLEKMGIPNIGQKLMSTLSGGQQQRVFLIRALVSNPEVLVLDEPTSALDPSFRPMFYQIIDELNQSGTTIIFITHDINESLNNRKVLYLDQKIGFYGCYEDFKSWKGDHHHV